MDPHRRQALVAGGLFAGVAVFYYWLADNLPAGVLFEQIGSDVTPKLLAVVIIGLAALLVAVDLLTPTRPAGGEAEPENQAAFRGAPMVVNGTRRTRSSRSSTPSSARR